MEVAIRLIRPVQSPIYRQLEKESTIANLRRSAGIPTEETPIEKLIKTARLHIYRQLVGIEKTPEEEMAIRNTINVLRRSAGKPVEKTPLEKIITNQKINEIRKSAGMSVKNTSHYLFLLG